MLKTLKFVSSLLIILFFLVGCKASNVVTVSTYDENYDNQQEERYDEIRDYLFDEYGDNLDEMKSDDLFEQYNQLFVQYGTGDSDYAQSRRNKFSGTVDLDNHTISYSDEIIDYEYTGNGVSIFNNDTELLDDTFIRMVNIAENKFRENKEANKSLLISAGWLPIVLFIIGLTAWINPRFIWYVEGGFRYRDVEPSRTALTIIKIQAIIAFGLTALLTWLLFQRMV